MVLICMLLLVFVVYDVFVVICCVLYLFCVLFVCSFGSVALTTSYTQGGEFRNPDLLYAAYRLNLGLKYSSLRIYSPMNYQLITPIQWNST